MKPYIYIVILAAIYSFLISSCGTGRQPDANQPDASHTHDDNTHDGHTHNGHTHYHEHTEQEEFVVNDSLNADSVKKQHDHDHKHDIPHVH